MTLPSFQLDLVLVPLATLATVVILLARAKADWSRVRRRSYLYISASVLIVMFFSFAAWSWARPPSLLRDAPPETVARAYFELDSKGRFLAARHFVYHSGLPQAADGSGYRGATILSVTKATALAKDGLPSEYASLASLCQLTVNYHIRNTDDVGNPPGDYTATVELGRVTPNGRWLVLETGTGP